MKKEYLELHILIMLLLVIVVPTNYAESINPILIEQDDTYTYQYFNDILDGYSNTLQKIEQGDKSYLNDSIELNNHTKLIKQEIIYYESKNITTPSKYVIDPFYDFSENLVKLSESNYELDNNLNKNTFASISMAQINVMEINITLQKIEKNLNEIDNISVLKKENETLKFNTSEIRELIQRHIKEYKRYENISSVRYATILSNNTKDAQLIITTSDENPILFEEIIIYGSSPNNELVKLYVENDSNNPYKIYPKNNKFLMNYVFNNIGNYEIYAQQDHKLSNTLDIKVSKIPTNIYMDSKYSCYVNNTIEIYGMLVDYKGNKINNGTININGKPIVLNNGTFNITKYSLNKGIEYLNIFYNGSEIYKSSNKTVEVEFLKRPVNIIIETDSNNISVGEEINIIGHVHGFNHPDYIGIFVNNTKYATIYTKGNFSTNISINESGAHVIYAYYGGSEIYQSSKSNELIVSVSSGFNIFNYAVIGLLIIIIVLIYYKKYRKHPKNEKELTTAIGGEREEEKTNNSSNINYNENYNEHNEGDYSNMPNSVEDMILLLPDEIGGAYGVLFNYLVKTYKLSKNITPRELLNIIKDKNPNIYSDLEFITNIHEKYTYKKSDIDNMVKTEYFETVKKVLREI